MLIAHPQSVREFLVYNGIVRTLVASRRARAPRAVLFVRPAYAPLANRMYHDLVRDGAILVLECTDDAMTATALFNMMHSRYRTDTDRHMFGEYDRFRLDKYKNASAALEGRVVHEPYGTYGYDRAVMAEAFHFPRDTEREQRFSQQVHKVADTGFGLFSSTEGVCPHARRAHTISIDMRTMLGEGRAVMDAMRFLENARTLYLQAGDVATLLVYLLQRAPSMEFAPKGRVFLLPNGREGDPSEWFVAEAGWQIKDGCLIEALEN